MWELKERRCSFNSLSCLSSDPLTSLRLLQERVESLWVLSSTSITAAFPSILERLDALVSQFASTSSDSRDGLYCTFSIFYDFFSSLFSSSSCRTDLRVTTYWCNNYCSKETWESLRGERESAGHSSLMMPWVLCFVPSCCTFTLLFLSFRFKYGLLLLFVVLDGLLPQFATIVITSPLAHISMLFASFHLSFHQAECYLVACFQSVQVTETYSVLLSQAEPSFGQSPCMLSAFAY